MMAVRGRLIAFEGGEGSGKSTQARLLADDIGAVLTREPGGTELGRRLRRLVLGADSPPLGARAEALVLLADRAQHVAEVIEPWLSQGRVVVTDRFSGSTLAYQGYGRGLDLDVLAEVSRWAAGGVEPDLVVFLDVAAEVAEARAGGPTDRMEAEGREFHDRVVAGYRALADADPRRWRRVDGSGPVEEVAGRVRRAVTQWRETTSA